MTEDNNRGPLDYQRYAENSGLVYCPRAASDLTPCIAREGAACVGHSGRCISCDADPRLLLLALRVELDMDVSASVRSPMVAADKLRSLVRDTTRTDRDGHPA